MSEMRTFTEPKVYLVGYSRQVGATLREFCADEGIAEDKVLDLSVYDPDKIPETSGRLCYMSFNTPRPGGNETYLSHIKSSGHGSVLEHPNFNFIFTRVSRSLTHELVRHRAGFAYSQLSQRYVDESVCDSIVPRDLQEEVAAAQKLCQERGVSVDKVLEAISDGRFQVEEDVFTGLLWLHCVLYSTETYKRLSDYLFNKVGRKVVDAKEGDKKTIAGWAYVTMNLSKDEQTSVRKRARGAARSVLPNATETKIYVTANARAVRHFIEMRGSVFAEEEIRLLAYKVWQTVSKVAPNLFNDYQWTLGPSGFPLNVTTPTKKV